MTTATSCRRIQHCAAIVLWVIVLTLLPSSIEAFSGLQKATSGTLSTAQKNHSSPSRLQMTQSQEQDDNSTDDDKIQMKTYNPLRLLVLRLGLTEPAWTSPWNYQKSKAGGEFTCAYCGHTLFDSQTKYDSGSGWPSFWRSSKDDSIAYKREWNGSFECTCQKCQSHLGHVFMDGPLKTSAKVQETNLVETIPESDPVSRTGDRLPRYCINGAAIRYREE